MYCPWCGAQNAEQGKFCRSCGRELASVAMAMTGELVEEDRHGRRRKRFQTREAKIQNGIRELFVGAAFLIAAVVLVIARQFWGVWMLFPSFMMLGKGVGALASAKALPFLQTSPPRTAEQPPARSTGEISTPRYDEALPPPSVTEGTTRMMDPQKQDRENA